MPLEAWVFVGACALVCAVLVGFGADLLQRARSADDDGEVE